MSSVIGYLSFALLSLVVTRCLCCTHVVQRCENPSFSNLAEYVITGQDQSVCLTTNSTEYSLSSSAAIVRTQNISVGQFCSSVPLQSSRVCASNDSQPFPNQSVLFISLSDLANQDTMETVDFNFINSSAPDVMFTLNYAPKGIYPSQTSPATFGPGNVFQFDWIGYDTPSLSYSFTPADGSAPNASLLFSDRTWTPPCISPTQDNVTFTISPLVPRRAVINFGPAQVESAGTFIIQGSGETSSLQLIIQETERPTLLTTSDTFRFQINMSASITCEIQFSVSSPSWYFNNVPITNSNSEYSILQTRLFVSMVTIELGGWYTCVASNSNGNTFKDFLVIPVDSPKIVLSSPFPGSDSYTVFPGSTVVLPCSATGTPPPNIAWFSDSKLLINSSGKVRIDSTSGALIISNYTKDEMPTDGFMCRASNVVGAVNSTLVTVVLNGATTVPNATFPVFNIRSSESVNLSCPMLQNSQTINWFKDGVTFTTAGSMLEWAVTGTDNGSTGGVYCCRVVSVSNITDTNCYIVNIRLPASLSTTLFNSSVQTGRNISYFISTETENNLDLPVLSWYYDNVLLSEDSQRLSVLQERVGVSTLKIRTSISNDSGLYSVTGRNFVNTVRDSAEVRVIDNSCGTNMLSSGNGEGIEDTVRSDWGITLGDQTAMLQTSLAEVHFVLSPNSSETHPTISQTVTVNGTGEMKACLSCRMRTTSLSSSLLPRVNLSVPSNSSTITLPFNTLNSWQWVDTDVLFTAVATSSIMVTMEIDGDSDSQSSVLFDDFCLSVAALSISSSPLPTSSSTTPSDSPTKPSNFFLDYLNVMIIGIAIGGAAVLCALLLCIAACCCFCCSRRRSRKKNALIQELTESVNRKNTNMEENSVPLAVKDEEQPVYVIPGETPIYLDTDLDRGNSSSPVAIENQKSIPLSTPYDYPSITNASSRSPGSSVPNSHEFDSYDYARSPKLHVGTAPKHVLHQSPLTTSPAITTGNSENLLSSSVPSINDPAHKNTIFVNLGNVERLSKLFGGGNKEDKKDKEEEEDVYEICDPDTEPTTSFSKVSIHKSVSSSSNVESFGGLKKEKKENEYTMDIEPNSPQDASRQTFSSGSQKPSSASVTTMPLPSLPTEENRQEMYESLKCVPSEDPPKDSNGYLSLVDTKKEEGEDYYDDPTMNGSQIPVVHRNREEVPNSASSGVYTSIRSSDVDDPSYAYCNLVPNSQANPDNVYAVPSLEDDSRIDPDSMELLNKSGIHNETEHIYY